jgi:ATP-binding cassette subfamily B protein
MKIASYSKSHSTEFIARQSFIGQSASTALNLVITTGGRDLLTLVGLVVVMVLRDPLLAAIALIFVPVAAFTVRKIGASVRKIMANEFQGAMTIMESLQETAQGIRVVKAFTLESFMRERQARGIESFQRAANRLAAVSSRTSPLMESLAGFAIAGVVLYGGLRVIYSGQTPGALFSFITSVIMSYEPMKRLASFHVNFTSALFGVGLLYDFLDQPDEERESPDEPELAVTAGRARRRRWSAARAAASRRS